ncbi:amidohydrolase family protein [Mycobacterium sp.]|uniref:amidohydrolase family protein n=1 Tax=Mycobacterium sp. TaxID=1785 RepID=UPI003BB13F71
MTIDVHAHTIIPGYHDLLADLGIAAPGYGTGNGLVAPTEDVRISLMDEAGIDRQLLSAMSAPYTSDKAGAVRAARCVNDAHAELVSRYPNRLAAYAALPLPHLDESLAELERCLDGLGMIGVALQCSCLDESVAAEHFDPIYSELDRRSAVIFFHPCVNGLCSRLVVEWALAPTAGTVFEDTTIALHLMLRHIPHRYPNLRFVIPHLGGALPMLLNRLDNQLPVTAPDLPELPSQTARRFFYDTMGHGSQAALRCAVDAFGSDRIVPGSDYPVLLPFESYRDTFEYLRHAGLPEVALRNILVENTDQLLARA